MLLQRIVPLSIKIRKFLKYLKGSMMIGITFKFFHLRHVYLYRVPLNRILFEELIMTDLVKRFPYCAQITR
jgi:hypothetical protein